MDAKLHELHLSDGTKVFLATRLTYGEYKAILMSFLSDAKGEISQTGGVQQSFDGAATLRFNEKKILTIVKKIVNPKGEDVPVNMDVINGLDADDGEDISRYCDGILAEIKKKQSSTPRK